MAWFIDNIELIGTPANVFSTVDILTILILSTILCVVAALTYKYTHEGISYSPSFVHTIIMFGVLVSAIMLIIGSNIARAFTLMGALSIVRFRNAIKDTRDVGFIFFMMTIGMAVGTRFYSLAMILTIFVSLIVIAMKWFNFASNKKQDMLLKIYTPTIDHEKAFNSIFSKHLNHWKLINVENREGTDSNELVYMVGFKKTASKQEFIHEIKKLNEHNWVSVFGTEHLVY